VFHILPFSNRWAGIAKGIGVEKIIGRIHMVQIQIENDFLISSFSVLERQPMDMLLGLDMLRRHQVSLFCIIGKIFSNMTPPFFLLFFTVQYRLEE
jgi:hypothetical protein